MPALLCGGLVTHDNRKAMQPNIKATLSHLVPLLALVIKLYVSASWAEDVFPVRLQRFKTRSGVRTPAVRTGIAIAGDVSRLINRSTGLGASFHSVDDLQVVYIHTLNALVRMRELDGSRAMASAKLLFFCWKFIQK
jgi:hypothetical protein